MRTTIVLVMALSLTLVSTAIGQELLWQGSLENGSVSVTENVLGAKSSSGFPDAGLPITISRWNMEEPGYACRYYTLSSSGQLSSVTGEDGDFFNSIPDAGNTGWYLAGRDAPLAKAASQLQVLPVDARFERRWQLDNDRFAVRAGTRTYVVDSSTGGIKLLADDAGFIEIVAGADGRIAMTGMLADGRIMMRVYDADGRVLLERITASYLEGIRHLNMDSAGSFVEYSLGTAEPFSGEGLDFRDRMRFDIDRNVEQPIDNPLPQGRLIARGYDTAIWVDGEYTLVQQLDDRGTWQFANDLPRRTFSAMTLPGGLYVLAFQENDGAGSAVFDRDGSPVLELPSMGLPFTMTRHDAGLVVVHALDRTTVFSMPEQGGTK